MAAEVVTTNTYVSPVDGQPFYAMETQRIGGHNPGADGRVRALATRIAELRLAAGEHPAFGPPAYEAAIHADQPVAYEGEYAAIGPDPEPIMVEGGQLPRDRQLYAYAIRGPLDGASRELTVPELLINPDLRKGDDKRLYMAVGTALFCELFQPLPDDLGIYVVSFRPSAAGHVLAHLLGLTKEMGPALNARHGFSVTVRKFRQCLSQLQQPE